MDRSESVEWGNAESTAPAFHGYARPAAAVEKTFRPPLTVTISRETGSRGKPIARRTAELLGWQFLDQETLQYVAQNPDFAAGVKQPLDPLAEKWVEARFQELGGEAPPGANADLGPLVRTILEIGAQGETVVLGRGAGYILPNEARLNVRLISPEKDRIAYICQVERMSYAEAEAMVRQRDRARRRYMIREFGRSPRQLVHFDLVLNAAELGVEGCAGVISAAAREKDSYLRTTRRRS